MHQPKSIPTESGVELSTQISALATAPRGLRSTGSLRRVPLHGVCVHMTGSGPAEKAAKNPAKSALTYALDYYLDAREGYPHYVVDYDGSIIATCDERRIAAHVSWRTPGGRSGWDVWQAPEIWSQFWNPRGIHSPVDFLPADAGYANQVYLGIELLATQRLGEYTNQQYLSLARLISDIADRHALKLTQVPGPRLLGHEDLNPITRFGRDGQGYDPGALRAPPLFSWERLAETLADLADAG